MNRVLSTILLWLLCVGLVRSTCYIETCDQRCEVEEGSAVCKCLPGFSMGDDQKCHLEPAFRVGSLIFTDFVGKNEVILEWPLFDNNSKTNTNPNDLRVRVPPMDNWNVGGVAWDTISNHLVFLYKGVDFNLIFRSSQMMSIAYIQAHYLSRFAYDWTTGNIYYAAKDHGIGVCSSKACSSEFIKKISNTSEVVAVILHPWRARIIWCEWDDETDSSVISWAGMDGNYVEKLHTRVGKRIRSLAMDYPREILYILLDEDVWYVDLSRIFSGERVNTLKPEPFFIGSRQMINVSSLLAFDDFFFFVDSNTAQLLRLPRSFNQNDNETLEAFVVAQLNGFKSILTVDNPAFYETLEVNPCLNANCSKICLLSPTDSLPTKSCACPVGEISIPSGECISTARVGNMLRRKAESNATTINAELTNHRTLMEGNSIGISWALVLTSFPAMLINMIICFMLIHVIVTDYVQYLSVINQ